MTATGPAIAASVLVGVVITTFVSALTIPATTGAAARADAPAPPTSSTPAPAGSPVPGLTPPPAPPSAPPPVPAPAPTPTPTRLAIPAIDVTSDLIDLGVNPDGTVEVPEQPLLAGWYERGTPPGRPGSAVVLGHVDSVDGPAVFARLAGLRPGAHVVLDMSNGSTRRFRVDRIETYANADFPAHEVYAGTTSRKQLNLVTCGGRYDADLGGWQGNVVVYTEQVPGLAGFR